MHPDSPNRKLEGRACSLCERRPAFYVVGARFFCGDHKAEAYAEAKRRLTHKTAPEYRGLAG